MSYSDQHYGAGNVDCELCGGVGYVAASNVPYTHPMHGKARPCPECRPELQQATPLEFGIHPARAALEKATLYALERIAAGDYWQTVLVAPPDGGQTELLRYGNAECLKAGLDSRYFDYAAFESAIDRAMSGADQQSDTLPFLERLIETRVLWLDEIPSKIADRNAGGNATYKAQLARRLIEARYRDRKSTIYAVNIGWWDKPRGELGDVYWSVKSRMEESDVARMDKALPFRTERGRQMTAERMEAT